MSYQYPSASLSKLIESNRPPDSVEIELVTDEIVQIVIYLSINPARIDVQPSIFAFATDRVAVWFDTYTDLTFRQFDIFFRSIRSMMEAQKDKDRKKAR